MAFQPRGSNPNKPLLGKCPPADSTKNTTFGADADFLNSLVDQIAGAVREKLVAEGVPITTKPKSSPHYTRPADWQHLIHNGADRIGHSGDGPFQSHILSENKDLAAKIDHTLLKPDATKEEIQRVCEEARKYDFATVCVNSAYVGLVAQLLKGSNTKAIAVVGFPLGAAATATKGFEAREAVKQGAQEIDMVINIGALKGKDYALVLDDIKKVVEAAHPYPVKVILETSSLNDEEKVIASALSKAAGAAFVKTSTGFASGGATAEDIALMRRVVGPEMGVKASGGIRTYEDAAKMIEAGASRIGASASVAIVTKAKSPEKSSTEKGVKKPYKNSLY